MHKNSLPDGKTPSEPPVTVSRSRYIRKVIGDEFGVRVVHPRLVAIHALMSLLPYQAGSRIRPALYRLAGFSIGPRTLICDRLRLWGDAPVYKRLAIGSDCFINWGCSIDLNGPVTLGDNVVLGFGVTIVTATHQIDNPGRRAGNVVVRPVTIEERAWIAANALILPGVTIGAGAVVGAGSIVTQNVPPDMLVAGNPARVIRTLPTSDTEG